MKKIAICTFIILAAITLATAPASACNQLCRYSAGGDECVTVGWFTGQACHMDGLSCIDDGCWTATSQTTESVTFLPAANESMATNCRADGQVIPVAANLTSN